MIEYIVPNKICKIELVAKGNQIQFFRGGKLVYNFNDEFPYAQGWFRIRTIENHMTIDSFKVYRIEDKGID